MEEEIKKQEGNVIPIQVGNIEILTVKLLAEINEQLKKIIELLDK